MKFDDWEKLPHGPIDQKRLKAFEGMLGLKLPADFRQWLEVVNGGKPKNTCVVVSDGFGVSCFHHIYGLHSGADYLQLDRVNEILHGNLNSGLIAFADDAGGNKFTISLRPEHHGAVMFWDHETGDEYFLGEDFQEFVSALQSEEQLIPRDDLEKILRKDDPVMLDRWLQEKEINEKDKHNRSPIEKAAIYRSNRCIGRLHQLGAEPFDSLKLARQNLEFFPDHQATVDLIEKLFP